MKPSEITLEELATAVRLGAEFETICRDLVLLLEGPPEDNTTTLMRVTMLARRAKGIYMAEAENRAEATKLRRLSLGVES